MHLFPSCPATASLMRVFRIIKNLLSKGNAFSGSQWLKSFDQQPADPAMRAFMFHIYSELKSLRIGQENIQETQLNQGEQIRKLTLDTEQIKKDSSYTKNAVADLSLAAVLHRQGLWNIQKVMGVSFEKLIAGLVESVLVITGKYESPLLTNYKIHDPTGFVHGTPQLVEYDVFVKSPGLVFESKGHVGQENFDRVQLFARKVLFARKSVDPLAAVFVCTSMDKPLIDEAKKILGSTGIFLVIGTPKEKDITLALNSIMKKQSSTDSNKK